MVNKIPSLLALFAAAIVSVISIIQQIPFFDYCFRLIIVIIIFYVIGFIARIILNKFLYPEENSEEDIEDDYLDFEEQSNDASEQPDDSEE